jgi:hypothetical protein
MFPVLVGSRAASVWYPDFRECNDWDYFCTKEDVIDLPGTRLGKTESFYHPSLEEWDWEFWTGGPTVASSNELYTIKVSHAFWSNRWAKHIQDVMFFQSKGCEVIPELFDLLYGIWVEHYGAKRARLRPGTKPQEFFNARVDRKYDHDSLHASVAYYDEPMFNRILRDGEAVAVDRSKFNALSFDDKCKLVREEVFATALERKIIPSNYTDSPLRAYRWALEQTVTSYSKGWFPYWIVTNMHAGGLDRPDVEYVEVHRSNSHKLILL